MNNNDLIIALIAIIVFLVAVYLIFNKTKNEMKSQNYIETVYVFNLDYIKATDQIFISCLDLNFAESINSFSDIDDIVYEFLERKFTEEQLEFIRHEYNMSITFEQHYFKELGEIK